MKGRKPLPPEVVQSAVIRERVAESVREKYQAVGAKKWLLAALKRAKKLPSP
jgi:hypothetical protein